MDILINDWRLWKTTAILKKQLSPQFGDKGESYSVWATDGADTLLINLPKTIPDPQDASGETTVPNPDAQDFEKTVMPNCNLSTGTTLSPFAKPTHRFDGKTVIGAPAPGQATNIDMKVVGAAGRTLNGGKLIAYDADRKDTVTFQVIDLDDVLGYNEQLGGPALLDEFVTWGVFVGFPMDLVLPYSVDIPEGLYIRCIYASRGALPPMVTINYNLHRPLNPPVQGA